MTLKLGKKPAVARPTDFKFADYLDTTALPKVPASFGFDAMVKKTAWLMLGNGPDPTNPRDVPDGAGDCAWAAACHEHMAWGARGAGMPTFTAANALSDYSACTGYNPRDPSSDQGTDMGEAMSYRRRTGIIDTGGKRHKIGASLSVDPGNITQLWQALYVLQAVEIGIEFPETAMTQFNAGETWSVVKGAQIEGGHDIPIFSKQGSKTMRIVTWAQLHAMTDEFFSTYCDEVYAIVAPDVLDTEGVTARGLNVGQLNSDLAAL